MEDVRWPAEQLEEHHLEISNRIRNLFWTVSGDYDTEFEPDTEKYVYSKQTVLYEAVSRGARYAVFVENNKKACACIEDNIHFTKFDRETKLLQSDVISAIRSMEGKYRFDVIFMDPPYRHEYEKEVLECLKDSSILKEDTLIVVEASLDTSFDYLNELGFTLKKLKTYKTNVHAFITKAE